MGDKGSNKTAGALPLREQYKIMDSWLKFRLDHVLAKIMERSGLDMWVVLAREYNEDPIFKTLVPSLVRTASRLSCLVFHHKDDGSVDCLSISRHNPLMEGFYKSVWDSKNESQWDCLNRLIAERRPSNIGINHSESFALADGLTKSLHDVLLNELKPEYRGLLTSAEALCVGWLEKRGTPELEVYPEIYDMACTIIEEAFSESVVKPGKTTTQEVEWWMMEKINELGLRAWFTPTVDLQRRGAASSRLTDEVILRGDLLHCDVGIEYLGLCTDTQRLAYVLKEGEADVPEGLKSALSDCNSFQDRTMGRFAAGKTGNEVLEEALKAAEEASIKAMLYTHPIGCHGHGAGPTIGLWDKQARIPVRGDYPIYFDTCYALELNTASRVPEWGDQEVTIFLEETICFTESGASYLVDRQREFIRIASALQP